MEATGLPVFLRAASLEPQRSEDNFLADQESVVIILGGSCAIEFTKGGPRWTDLGERADVFSGRATACYVPIGRGWQITGGPTGVRYAVASAAATTQREPYLVTPDEITVERRGSGVSQREVHNLIDQNKPADGLLVGETFSDGAVWSSYPPHKHDKHNPPDESHHQESFYVRVSPPSGFGLFLHYPTVESDREVTVVQDGDIVQVESGYHSFVVAAGHRFYYLWALAGSQRELHFHTDPRHQWLLGKPEETLR